jgi:hypothetical protein
MFKLLFFIGLTLFISTGFGILLQNVFKVNSERFSTPIGFAALLFTLQMLYYPIQLFNLSSFWIHSLSLLVYIILFFYSLFVIVKILKQVFQWDTIWIFIYFIFFLFVFYNMSISIPRADGQMYLNYIAQNVDIDNLNMFNLWTGQTGSEFVSIYLFQGYYHFAAFVVKSIEFLALNLSIGSKVDTIVIILWIFTSLYAIISSMFIINIIRGFKYKHPMIPILLIIFTLFFTNFYYWKVAFAFYGNTWRSLFMAMFLYFIYKFITTQNRSYIVLGTIVFGASIAASSSSLFIGFAILLASVYAMLKSGSKTTFQDASYLGLSMVIYVLALMYNDHYSVFLVLLPIGVAYYGLHWLPVFKKPMVMFNEFLIKHSSFIFICILPFIAIVYSFNDMQIDPNYPWNFYHYFNDHASYDMVKNYIFLHSDWVDNGLNVLRWTSIGLIIFNSNKQDSERYFLRYFLLLLVFFVNPLTTSFISRMFASNVYYRAFESMFNVFSETFLFAFLLNYLWNRKWLFILVSTFLMFVVVFSHVDSFVLANPRGLYGYYINEGKNVLPMYKIKENELDVIKMFEKEIETWSQNKQITIVSHVDGLRTFAPHVYQVFTARQYWSAWDRVDQDFYQIARLWYDWEERPKDLDYSNSCSYLVKFEVDYVINEIWMNHEFDSAIDSCTEVIYANYDYKLRKVTR